MTFDRADCLVFGVVIGIIIGAACVILSLPPPPRK
jgi:gas vesicle protein